MNRITRVGSEDSDQINRIGKNGKSGESEKSEASVQIGRIGSIETKLNILEMTTQDSAESEGRNIGKLENIHRMSMDPGQQQLKCGIRVIVPGWFPSYFRLAFQEFPIFPICISEFSDSPIVPIRLVSDLFPIL